MSTFGLYLTDIYTPCHTFGCHNRATHFLGKSDSPNGTVYYVCEQCGTELKEQVIAVHEESKPTIEPNVPLDEPKTVVEEVTEEPKKAPAKKKAAK